MTPSTRNATKHTKARTRRRLTAQERLARDCRQAQHATEALQQALDDLGLPEDLVTEIGPVTMLILVANCPRPPKTSGLSRMSRTQECRFSEFATSINVGIRPF